jgi:hypothetical protein
MFDNEVRPIVPTSPRHQLQNSCSFFILFQIYGLQCTTYFKYYGLDYTLPQRIVIVALALLEQLVHLSVAMNPA